MAFSRWGATVAVNMFFVMSGFYMALVLDTKYRKNIWAFYRARAIRLYPIYFVAMLVSLIVIYSTDSFLAQGVRPNIERLVSGDARWFLPIAVFSNVTFVGLDLGSLLCLRGYEITTVLNPTCYRMSGFAVIPQAWSLGAEVLFYLMVPFILRFRGAGIFLAVSLSLFTNFALVVSGLYIPPWDRMLFPAILLYSMLGVIVYRAYVRLKLPDLAEHRASIVAVIFLVISLLLAPYPAVLCPDLAEQVL